MLFDRFLFASILLLTTFSEGTVLYASNICAYKKIDVEKLAHIFHSI